MLKSERRGFSLTEANEALDRLRRGKLQGVAVLVTDEVDVLGGSLH